MSEWGVTDTRWALYTHFYLPFVGREQNSFVAKWSTLFHQQYRRIYEI